MRLRGFLANSGQQFMQVKSYLNNQYNTVNESQGNA